MKIRIFSVITAVLLLLCSAGCGKSEVKVVNKPVSDRLEVIKDGKNFGYTIIIPDSAEDELNNAAKELSASIKDGLKLFAKVKKDKQVKKSDDNYEILIGETNRAESKEALENLKGNRINSNRDFIVTVKKNKIIITSLFDQSLLAAVSWFGETFGKSEKDWQKLKKDYTFIYSYPSEDYSVAGNNIFDYSIVMPQDAQLVYGDRVKDFCESLEEKTGFIIPLKDTDDDESEYEIVVGNVKREGSQAFGGQRYGVWVSGKKLFVNGGTPEATAKAMRVLNEAVFPTDSKATALTSVPADYKLEGNFKPENDDYKLVWSDEFNSLNKDIWKFDLNSKTGKNASGKSKIPLYYNGLTIKNGMLHMLAYRDPDGTSYDSHICSLQTHEFLYGIYEFRVKFSKAPGLGTLWGTTQKVDFEKGIILDDYTNNTVEWDLLENFGRPYTFAANIHRWWQDKSGSWSRHTSLDGSKFAEQKLYTHKNKTEELSEKFHVYTLKWTPDIAEFSVDGKVFFSYDLKQDVDGLGVDNYNTPVVNWKISSGIDSANYGEVWKEGDPTRYETIVDYARLYQKDIDGGYTKLTPYKGTDYLKAKDPNNPNLPK